MHPYLSAPFQVSPCRCILSQPFYISGCWNIDIYWYYKHRNNCFCEGGWTEFFPARLSIWPTVHRSAASSTPKLILQPFRCFTYFIGTSPTSQLIHQPSAALPTLQLIIQPFRCFTYVIGTSPTSQLIHQPFCCFTYIAAHSTALPLLHLRHRHFMYFTLRAAHA